MPVGIDIDLGVVRGLTGTFREYIKYNTRELPLLVHEGGRKLADEIFLRAPRAVAGDIWAKLQSLGPKFVRAPWSYVRKVAPNLPEAKLASDREREIRKERNAALEQAANLQREASKIRPRKTDPNKARKRPVRLDKYLAQLEGKAVRREKANRLQAEANRIRRRFGKRYTLEEQRYAAYNFRVGHIGYIASTFIPAMRQLGSKLRVAQGVKAMQMRPMSRVEMKLEKNSLVVEIINEAPGVVTVQQRTRFVEAAMVRRMADMADYIERKRGEMVTIFNRTGRR